MKQFFLCILIGVGHFISAQPKSFQSYGIGGGGAMFFPKINPDNEDEFYISCDMSELFHTTDFGETYTQLPFQSFQSLNVSTYEYTKNPQIAYSNFNDGNEGYPVKTTNGGKTWTKLLGFNAALGGVYRMFANYEDPKQLIMNYYGDVVMSNDGGNTFQLLRHCADLGAGIIVAGVFYDGPEIYVATNEGMFKSNDYGATFAFWNTSGIPSGQVIWHFSAAKSGNTKRFICLAADKGDVYNGLMPYEYYGFAKGVFTMSDVSAVWKSSSAGINFSNDFVMFTGMALNDVNTMYLAGSDAGLNAPLVLKSTDAGISWSKVFKSANNLNIKTGWSGFQGDKNWSWGESAFGIAVAPRNSQKLAFGDYGFVHVSSDGGAKWNQAYVDTKDQHAAGLATPTKRSYRSVGLENTTCWQIHWVDAQNLFACFSDIGAIRSKDAGKSWSYDYSGFSVNSLYRMVQTTTGNLYGACSNVHDLYQSTRLADVNLDASDANGKIVFSTDKGANWTTLHQFGHPVFWLALDPKREQTCYASVVHYGGGNGQGGLWVTNDLDKGPSSTWTKLPNAPRTEGHPASIVVLKDGKVLCTFSARRNNSGAFTKSSGVFVYDPASKTWTDLSDSGMQYWTKDIVLDPNDTTQNTWYVGVFSGWGGAPNGLGGLYMTRNGGQSWSKLTGNSIDRVTSISFNPKRTTQAYLTTETQGLWVSDNMDASLPTFIELASYSFRQPERIYFNPYLQDELWVTSFGNGMKMGRLDGVNGSEELALGQPDWLVGPNPFSNSLSFSYSSCHAPALLTVHKLDGTLVAKMTIDKANTELDTKHWTDGVYVVRKGEFARKVVKVSSK